MKKRVLEIVLSVIFVLNLIVVLSIYLSPENKFSPEITGAAPSGGVSITIEGNSQFIPLQQGWNFISFYLNMQNYSISEVFSSIEGYYAYILGWNSSAQEFDVWSSQGAQEFTSFNENKSYFVFMTEAKNLSVGGRFYGNKTIVLVQGWEAPDYIYEFPSNITNTTFYGINFSYMQKWNVSSQEFLVYSHLSSSQPFDKILASEGYLILTEGGNLTYVR